MTTNSSHLASKNEKDFLEQVWENGQILGAKVTSSNRTTTTQNKPLYIGYSTNHSNNNEDVIINNTTKRRTNSNSSLLNHFSAQNLSSSHIDFQSSQSKTFHNPNEKFQQSHLFSYSTPLKKPRLDYSNSKKQNLGCDQRTGIVNFSNFSIPPMFLKSNNHQSSTRINVSKEAVIESAKDSSQHGVRKFQHQKTLTLTAANKLSNLDEHSETATSHKSTLDDQYNNKQIQKSEAIKGKRKARGNEQPSSVCSLEASNDPNFSFRGHDEDTVDTNDSPYLSDDDEETPENMIKEKLAREGKRSFKNSEIHNSSERKRRDKINKKIRTLKELIPNCHKTDKASMLDDAIEYLKTLQLQLQIMSMGRGICMPMNQHMNMNAQHLIGFMPPQAQFPIPQQMSASGNCVTDNINNIVQMFGFSNQLPLPLPMSIPNAPFIPIIGNSNSTTTNSTFGNQNQPADWTRGSF